MKNALIGIFVVVLLVAIPGLLQRQWPGASIDLESCQPDGPVAKLSRAWNPLSFWAEQMTTLQIALQTTNLQEFVDDCQIKDSENKEKVAQCIAFYKRRHDGMQRCLGFSELQCRREGGRC
jgi:hypothetical protein